MSINNPANPFKAVHSGGASGGSANSSSQGEVYSTEETRIGTWIDGKPLYRKVFQVEIRNRYEDESVVENLDYVETMVNISGFALETPTKKNGMFPINAGGPNTYSIHAYFINAKIKVYSGGGLSDYPATIIAEYTKTTD